MAVMKTVVTEGTVAGMELDWPVMSSTTVVFSKMTP